MRTLILDIETVGADWNTIDPVTQDILKRSVDRQADSPEEWMFGMDDMQHDLGLSPLTGSIIALGVYDVERGVGALYYVPREDGEPTSETTIDGFTCKVRTETELLKEFWEGALSYDTFVTFAGRTFDLPFLLHRSISCGVRPTRELMKYRYLAQQSAPYHIDLLDELTFYGAMRRQSLHLFCRAYGIVSSKESGISGAEVGDVYGAGRIADIIRYNIADVLATKELYEKWLQNLAPISFLNTIDL